MPIQQVVNYPNGAKLLIFSTGKTKYIPTRRYIHTKELLCKPASKRSPFQREASLREACDKFFIKIIEVAKLNYDPKRRIKYVNTTVQVRTSNKIDSLP